MVPKPIKTFPSISNDGWNYLIIKSVIKKVYLEHTSLDGTLKVEEKKTVKTHIYYPLKYIWSKNKFYIFLGLSKGLSQ